MNIYALVTQQCQSAGTSDTAQVQRLVGTLRSAGFSDDVPSGEVSTVSALVTELLQRRQLRTAKVASGQGRSALHESDRINSVNVMDRFIEIDAYIEKNQCPRCHTTMARVKLGSKISGGTDYLMANFCSACRTTLWVK